MKIFPAIDIKGGSAVRLTKGDYGTAKVYSDNPLDVANGFMAAGAECLHIVDLDGAKDGSTVNFDVAHKLFNINGLFTEIGGGIRSEAVIEKYLNAGAGRIILGTAAVENFGFLERVIKKYGNKIAVGVDAKNDKVAVKGWLQITDCDSFEFCKRLSGIGVKTIIYTDISKDGTLSGVNTELYSKLVGLSGTDIVASGGVANLDDIIALNKTGVAAVIVGKAIYEGKIDLKEALKVVK